ncbi:MAG: hypothetical protein A4E60_03571 [Syntrophorhabdus sp. PtaB.Bin047]|nr:MAG: hypothetical protein A4E60_03571 [Syntrophorhabdus sp. PtaB.Bin047]
MFDHILKFPVRRRNHAHVDLPAYCRSHGLDLSVFEHPEEDLLKTWTDIAYLIKEYRAAVGDFKDALLVPHGPRESTLHIAEKLAFEERLRQRRTIDGQEGFLGPDAVEVYGPRDKLFPGSRFTKDKYGCPGVLDLFYGLVDLNHSLAVAHKVAEAVLLFQLVPEKAIVVDKGLLIKDLPHDKPDLVKIEGLCYVILRPLFHRFDRRVDGRIGSDDDNTRVPRQFLDRPQDIHAVYPRKFEIGYNEVIDRVLYHRHGPIACLSRIDRVPFAGHDLLQGTPELRVVFNDENACRVQS